MPTISSVVSSSVAKRPPPSSLKEARVNVEGKAEFSNGGAGGSKGSGGPPDATLAAIPHEVPVFLKKAYCMLQACDACDEDIAGWSEDGTIVVVKDAGKLATVVIPQYFKHNNFSSFVRQLNFYGFRKMKQESIKIDNSGTASNWRFKHENFLRGRPELLLEMKRHKQDDRNPRKVSIKQEEGAEMAEKGDSSTNAEIVSLKRRLDTMTSDVDKLTNLVKDMMVERKGESSTPDSDERVGVKRKHTPAKQSSTGESDVPKEVTPVKSDFQFSDMDQSESSELPPLACATDEALLLEDLSRPSDGSDMEIDEEIPRSSLWPVVGAQDSSHTIGDSSPSLEFVDAVLTNLEQDLTTLGSVCPPLPEIENATSPRSLESPPRKPETAERSQGYDSSSSTRAQSIDPMLLSQLQRCLSMFPAETQRLCVERLIAAITDPSLDFQKALDAAMRTQSWRDDGIGSSSSHVRTVDDTATDDEEDVDIKESDVKEATGGGEDQDPPPREANAQAEQATADAAFLSRAAAALGSILSKYGSSSSSSLGNQHSSSNSSSCKAGKKSSSHPSFVPIEA